MVNKDVNIDYLIQDLSIDPQISTFQISKSSFILKVDLFLTYINNSTVISEFLLPKSLAKTRIKCLFFSISSQNLIICTYSADLYFISMEST